jgi:hypothetical protein
MVDCVRLWVGLAESTRIACWVRCSVWGKPIDGYDVGVLICRRFREASLKDRAGGGAKAVDCEALGFGDTTGSVG